MFAASSGPIAEGFKREASPFVGLAYGPCNFLALPIKPKLLRGDTQLNRKCGSIHVTH